MTNIHQFKDRKIALFVAGYGNVAKELLKIIPSRDELLLVGVANSKRMSFSENGIIPDKVEDLLDKGVNSNIDSFCKIASEFEFPNKIFVDCTADERVAFAYKEFARSGFSVVACNKIAFSSPVKDWTLMKDAFLASGSNLLYETTVGAALPVLSTIRNLVQSNDKVTRVEAILSGTLNFILSNYNGEESLKSLVIKAKSLGYTEPDPRLDISGSDVARKALIISREMGLIREPGDVICDPLLPESLLTGTIEEFYEKLEEYEDDFNNLYKYSLEKGERLRYVAKISETNCKTGLESLPADHPLARTVGTDNSIIIFSKDYPNSITISGGGAGARQAAAGVFNDIILAGQKFIIS
ncbi:MAG: hypothetical protein PHV46_04485 [Bacteroidales bacterium]|nr:hypothetical protein [Bacteroidales bacterium]